MKRSHLPVLTAHAPVARSEPTITLMISNVSVCVWKYVNPPDLYAGILCNQYCLRSLLSINEFYRIRAPLPLMSFAIDAYLHSSTVYSNYICGCCSRYTLEYWM